MGLITTRQTARHEAHMHRLLTEIFDNREISSHAFFKGGTCARMLGFLDRFSVDLDFDLDEQANKEQFRSILHGIFSELGFHIKDESANALQFFLRYDAPENERNTVKLEMLDKVFRSNVYKPQYLAPIERTAVCQTIETMFANKLVAPMDRFERGFSIAGRDIYDIHHFFMQGYEYVTGVIEERRGKPAKEYLAELREFIDTKVTREIIEGDLNTLLPYEVFRTIRKHLKQEVLNFLSREIA